jgi:hypothetical protein
MTHNQSKQKTWEINLGGQHDENIYKDLLKPSYRFSHKKIKSNC